MSTITAERIAEIEAQLDAWSARHAAHEIGCGCNPYQDVIYALPEYDPEDPRNLAIPEQLDEYVLSDGTVIDGEREGWRITRPRGAAVTECINCRWNAESGLTHEEYVKANRMMAWLCDANAVRAHELPALVMPPRPENADPKFDTEGNVVGYTVR